ncbi:MAG: AAA family ATPase [Candidatus Pacearchaeota archaeon]
MFLKKLTIENIRSYKKQEIVFPKGSTLLSGDIGSGKTTILLAIEFALFGLEPGQKGNSLLRSGEDDAKVSLEFQLDDKEIIIERSLKRSKKSISQENTAITINKERFEGSVTEIKNKVLKLINYPSEFAKKTNLLYKFTVYTPQEEMKQIILEPGEIRLNTLRHVFGIDKYKRIEENAYILSSKLREKIRINEGMIYDLDNYKEELLKKKDELILLKEKQKKSAEEYRNAIEKRMEKEAAIKEIQEKIDEKKSLEVELGKSEILLYEKNQQIKTLKSNINIIKGQIEESKKLNFNEEEYNQILKRIEYQENKEDEIQKEYIVIIGKINSELSKLKDIENLKNKISVLQKCPTCLQEVSADYKKNIFFKKNEETEIIQKNINELLIKKNELNEQVESIKRQKEELKQKKSELDLMKIKLENIREKEKRILEAEKQRELLEKDVKILEKHIQSIKESILDYNRFDLIYEEKNKELALFKKLENELAIRHAEINKDLQFLEERINEKKLEIEKKENIKKVIEKIRELEYWISEKFINLVLLTEKQVMLTLKEEFSRLFSKWFSMLVSDTLTAKLGDDFSPIIEQQDYELDYEFLSGGERTAIALAYRLALNQVINSLLSNIKTRNLIILDEPTDGFSSTQLDKMKDILKELNVEQLILVSHEQKIEDFVDNIIKVYKEDGLTKIY